MTCPKCKRDQLNVIDSRRSGSSIRRRRECAACGARLSTVEISKNEYENMQQAIYYLKKTVGAIKNIIPGGDLI